VERGEKGTSAVVVGVKGVRIMLRQRDLGIQNPAVCSAICAKGVFQLDFCRSGICLCGPGLEITLEVEVTGGKLLEDDLEHRRNPPPLPFAWRGHMSLICLNVLLRIRISIEASVPDQSER
jgi:hypothetical protein